MKARPELEKSKLSPSLEKNRLLLEKALAHSAFRRGTSAYRFGLIPLGLSDHLPIMVNTKNSGQSQLTMVSWNLLADIHLYNNFMNISGTTHLMNALKSNYSAGNTYFNSQENKLFYFFSEFARYLYKNQVQGRIKVTRELLQGFISITQNPSNLARSRDPLVAEEKKQQVENARKEIMTVFIHEMNLDAQDNRMVAVNAHELKLSIKHSLELIHHIESSEGALKWSNRFKKIEKNKPLVATLMNTDFLCLQECSNPEDIKTLFNSAGKNHKMISYKIDATTTDNCVLGYDADQFNLVEEPIKFALEGKKPCIFAKFKRLDSEEVFIVASIHHQGGKHNLMEDLLKKIESLQKTPHENIPFYMLGDYNHSPDFFEKAENLGNVNIVYPAQGTMAGSDYGNVNKPIDAVVTNQPTEDLSVVLLNEVQSAAPAPRLPLVVEFESDRNIAYPGFFQRVESGIKQKDEEKIAVESLGVSHAVRSPLIKL